MGNLLVVIVLMLGIVAIAQLMRVYELSAQLRGKKEEEISHGDNVMNARLFMAFMIFYYVFFIWLMVKYGNGGLGSSASEHGVELDWLLNFNWVIIIVVFFITNTLLFYFAAKYYHREGQRAYWFPHNNKLELLWTSVPACVLAVIITYGLITWNDVMYKMEDGEKVKNIELYAKQFDWTARYAGEDNMLGEANFRMINGEYNALGIITKDIAKRRVNEIRSEVAALAIGYYRDCHNRDILEKLSDEALNDNEVNYLDTVKLKMKALDELSDVKFSVIVSEKKRYEMREKAERLQRHILKIKSLAATVTDKQDKAALDDVIAKEIHLVKGQEYEFQFRSQDVIHSAYFPHFRAQMNVVPGLKTRFRFKPIMTTEEMRAEKGDDKFDYILLCNKICGAAHYNMQLKVVVHGSKDEMDKWLKEQKTVKGLFYPEEAKPDPPAAVNPEVADNNNNK